MDPEAEEATTVDLEEGHITVVVVAAVVGDTAAEVDGAEEEVEAINRTVDAVEAAEEEGVSAIGSVQIRIHRTKTRRRSCCAKSRR